MLLDLVFWSFAMVLATVALCLACQQTTAAV
jgi:hypothetical protein